ncbi:MAG: hypothetical protein LIR50_07850 [Bacillota bacterium]|nr:hypothetical protein [Bacillota bacterium]
MLKKLIKIITVLTLITLVLAGCSSSDESNAQKAAKAFGTELYTVDSKKIDNFNVYSKISDFITSVKTMHSNDKTLKSLMTEDGYNTLVAGGENTLYTKLCIKGNYTMQVTDITLSKNAYDIKEGKAGYNFTAKLKFISGKDKTEKTGEGQGYIGLIKKDGQWKVFTYKMSVLPKLLKED